MRKNKTLDQEIILFYTYMLSSAVQPPAGQTMPASHPPARQGCAAQQRAKWAGRQASMYVWLAGLELLLYYQILKSFHPTGFLDGLVNS